MASNPHLGTLPELLCGFARRRSNCSVIYCSNVARFSQSQEAYLFYAFLTALHSLLIEISARFIQVNAYWRWLSCTDTSSELRPYYPLGTIGTVPRAYDLFRAYEDMDGRKIKIK
jgi:hypothetical protein